MAIESLPEITEEAIDGTPKVCSPVQFNLLTGAPELIPIEGPEPAEEGQEVRVDEGISLVKSEDGSQLILSGLKSYAMITSPMLTATVQARREQILAFSDERGLEFSKAVVLGKVKNQEKLLRYCGKYLKKEAPERFAKVLRLVVQLRKLWQRPLRMAWRSSAWKQSSSR